MIPGPTETEIREDTLEELSGLSDTPDEVVIADGDVWLSVQTAIDEKKIDLIVLGTRGRTGLSTLVLGSVAEEILRGAPCAVLTVGPHAPSAPARGGEFSEILYATDFSREALAAAPYAVSIAQEFQANLALLHAIPESEVSDLATRAEVESAYEDRLRQIVPPGSELWCEPHFIVQQGTHRTTFSVWPIKGKRILSFSACAAQAALRHIYQSERHTRLFRTQPAQFLPFGGEFIFPGASQGHSG
jgi:nucleotide-binding universal stress UspA family protein